MTESSVKLDQSNTSFVKILLGQTPAIGVGGRFERAACRDMKQTCREMAHARTRTQRGRLCISNTQTTDAVAGGPTRCWCRGVLDVLTSLSDCRHETVERIMERRISGGSYVCWIDFHNGIWGCGFLCARLISFLFVARLYYGYHAKGYHAPSILHGLPRLYHHCTAITPVYISCLLYTSPSPRDRQKSRMPSSA